MNDNARSQGDRELNDGSYVQYLNCFVGVHKKDHFKTDMSTTRKSRLQC